METKFIVVSPPRSGTQTITNLATALGFKTSHVPYIDFNTLVEQGYNFFANTPCYDPDFFIPLIEDKSYKFIYLDRDLKKVAMSWDRKGLLQLYNNQLYNMKEGYRVLDGKSYRSLFHQEKVKTIEEAKSHFERHRETVINSIPNDRLLLHFFDKEWEPLANFLQLDHIPKGPIKVVDNLKRMKN